MSLIEQIPNHHKITVNDDFEPILLEIMQVIAGYFDLDISLYKKKTRKKEVIEMKHWCMFYVYYYYNIAEIPLVNKFNLKNHTSFTSAKKKIHGLFETNDASAKQIWLDINVNISSNKKILQYNEQNQNKIRLTLTTQTILSVKKFDVLLDNSEKGIIFVGYSEEEIEQVRKLLSFSPSNRFNYKNDNLNVSFIKAKKEIIRDSYINLVLNKK